jgi:hypothetical protein
MDGGRVRVGTDRGRLGVGDGRRGRVRVEMGRGGVVGRLPVRVQALRGLPVYGGRVRTLPLMRALSLLRMARHVSSGPVDVHLRYAGQVLGLEMGRARRMLGQRMGRLRRTPILVRRLGRGWHVLPQFGAGRVHFVQARRLVVLDDNGVLEIAHMGRGIGKLLPLLSDRHGFHYVLILVMVDEVHRGRVGVEIEVGLRLGKCGVRGLSLLGRLLHPAVGGWRWVLHLRPEAHPLLHLQLKLSFSIHFRLRSNGEWAEQYSHAAEVVAEEGNRAYCPASFSPVPSACSDDGPGVLPRAFPPL